MGTFDRIAYFIENHALVRRMILAAMMVLTFMVYRWAMGYAEISDHDGIGTAAVIAALLTPLSALQGAIFKFYIDSRSPQTVAVVAPSNM